MNLDELRLGDGRESESRRVKGNERMEERINFDGIKSKIEHQKPIYANKIRMAKTKMSYSLNAN